MRYVRLLAHESAVLVLLGRRYALYLLTCIALLVVAGGILYGIVPIHVAIFPDGLDPTEVQKLESALRQSGVAVPFEQSGPMNAEALRRADAALGLGDVYGQLTALQNDGSTESAYLYQLIAIAFPPPAEDASSRLSKASSLDGSEILSLVLTSERHLASVAPAVPGRPFVPIVIALLAVFTPFLITLEAVRRNADTNLGAMVLAATRGAYLSRSLLWVAWGTIWGVVLLGLLLVCARRFFDLRPVEDFAAVALDYLPAGVFSGAAGVIVGTIVGSAGVVAGSAGYLFALLMFGGVFVPLGAAQDWVDWISRALPMRYFLPLLRRWLTEGHADVASLWSSVGDALTPLDRLGAASYPLVSVGVVALMLAVDFVARRMQ